MTSGVSGSSSANYELYLQKRASLAMVSPKQQFDILEKTLLQSDFVVAYELLQEARQDTIAFNPNLLRDGLLSKFYSKNGYGILDEGLISTAEKCLHLLLLKCQSYENIFIIEDFLISKNIGNFLKILIADCPQPFMSKLCGKNSKGQTLIQRAAKHCKSLHDFKTIFDAIPDEFKKKESKQKLIDFAKENIHGEEIVSFLQHLDKHLAETKAPTISIAQRVYSNLKGHIPKDSTREPRKVSLSFLESPEAEALALGKTPVKEARKSRLDMVIPLPKRAPKEPTEEEPSYSNLKQEPEEVLPYSNMTKEFMKGNLRPTQALKNPPANPFYVNLNEKN